MQYQEVRRLVLECVCVCREGESTYLILLSFPHTHTPPTLTTYLLIALAALISVCWCCSGCVEGSVNVMGRKGGNRLFPTLTLTLTFHHPEQSLLHKLHWLDHVIRVGVFSVLVCVARAHRHRTPTNRQT